MRLLLDSRVLVWWTSTPSDIAAPALSAIDDPGNEVFVSVATAWELAIKSGLGRLRMPADLEGMIDQRGLQKLGIGFGHAALAGALPRHHGDPFDRMLIAQAQSEGLTLVTRDRVFSAYGILLLKA